jgi:hypothetical protein
LSKSEGRLRNGSAFFVFPYFNQIMDYFLYSSLPLFYKNVYITTANE